MYAFSWRFHEHNFLMDGPIFTIFFSNIFFHPGTSEKHDFEL